MRRLILFAVAVCAPADQSFGPTNGEILAYERCVVEFGVSECAFIKPTEVVIVNGRPVRRALKEKPVIRDREITGLGKAPD